MKSRKGVGWLFWGILVLLAMIVAGSSVAYAHTYRGRVFPGIRIGTLDLGGKTVEEARQALDAQIDGVLSRGFLFSVDGALATLSPVVLAPEDPDLSRELVTFDRARALEEAFEVGRGPNPFLNLFEQLAARLRGVPVIVPTNVNLQELQVALHEKFAAVLTSVEDAQFEIEVPARGARPVISIMPARAGTTFDAEAAWTAMWRSLSKLESPHVTLMLVSVPPTIQEHELAPLIPSVQSILGEESRVVRFEDHIWTLTNLAGMLRPRKDAAGALHLALGGEVLDELFEMIEAAINRPPRNAKFALENGRVREFQGSEVGIALDREATRSLLEQTFLEEGGAEITVVTKVTEPELTTAEVNELGIESMLGVGVSNFRGSPPNRIKNIKNGARLIHGTLIPPDAEFSLLAALRPFTGENGYLPELVIKGDKIEPEVGGGLCQLGTTTFRAAMHSGMPITARRNHSLVVTYYNDPSNGNPGTDATIYDPAPDFRFKNDTGAHILITTEADTDRSELRFTFWGKSDGRTGSYSAPVVQRWIPTGPTKIIETTDLPPGKKKCQSRHPGADTSFTYTLERPRGTKEETVFTSHYRPLPEICLLGVEAKAKIEVTDTESLTPTEAADLTTE